MNKVMIPALLVFTVMIAGAFAFIPVQEASTVHTTIQNTTVRESNTFTTTDWNIANTTLDELILTCTSAAIIHEINFEAGTNVNGAGDNIDMIIDPDGAGNAVFATTTQADIFAANAPADEAALLSNRGLSQGISLITGGTVTLDLVAEEADDGKIASVAAVYTSQSTCTWTQS